MIQGWFIFALSLWQTFALFCIPTSHVFCIYTGVIRWRCLPVHWMCTCFFQCHFYRLHLFEIPNVCDWYCNAHNIDTTILYQMKRFAIDWGFVFVLWSKLTNSPVWFHILLWFSVLVEYNWIKSCLCWIGNGRCIIGWDYRLVWLLLYCFNSYLSRCLINGLYSCLTVFALQKWTEQYVCSVSQVVW